MSSSPRAAVRRPAWLTTPILMVSVLSVGAGIGQFAVTAVIGDVASAFGTPGADASDLTLQIGLPTTTLGVALALVRVASLGALPAAALADRFGRRRLLLTLAAGGLALTALSAAAPGFWWYVALVALARPMLSALNGLAGVVAAEETTSKDRSAAIALITAAYGIGAGVVSLGRSALPGDSSFRPVMALALVPLLAMPLLARRIREPRIARAADHVDGVPGAVPAGLRGRVALLSLLAGTIAVATGPGFTYLFVYAEDVLGASPGFTAALVLGAGPAGLVGIVVGRFGADRIGRRVTAGVMMACSGLSVAYAYSGTPRDLAVGYLAAIAFSTGFAPATGALAAELVPTSVRATVAGWVTVAGVFGAVLGLLLFGVLAEAAGSFANGARAIGIGVTLVAVGFALLPETRGRELDDHSPYTR